MRYAVQIKMQIGSLSTVAAQSSHTSPWHRPLWGNYGDARHCKTARRVRMDDTDWRRANGITDDLCALEFK
jgi:hypothetical protein